MFVFKACSQHLILGVRGTRRIIFFDPLQGSLISLGWFSINLTSMTIVKCEWPTGMHPVQILTAAIDAQGVKSSDFVSSYLF